MYIYLRHMMSITCLLISANALANGYKGETPPLSPVTIPQLKGGFDISISALYMTPSSSDLDYLTVVKQPIEGDIFFHNYNLAYSVTPNYNWGFILDLGYIFPNTANDVRLDWMAFHSNYNDEHTVLGQMGMFTNVIFYPTSNEFLQENTDYATASASINYKLDALDLTFGQYLTIYQRLQTRVFTGLRYARVDSDMRTAYTALWDTNTSTPTAGGFSGNINSSFNGLGPMMGSRVDFDLGKGLSLTGVFDIALLVGQLGFNGDQIIHENADTPLRTSLNWGPQKVIAPAFDAKFGMNYQYQFDNGTQLMGELGYQVSQYIDVIEQMNRAASFNLMDALTTNPSFCTDVTNFGLRGPYLTLRVKI